MKTLFDKTKLSTLELPNRCFRSATYEGLADEQGRPTPELLQAYTALAKGGVGTIITGLACVTPLDKPVPRPIGLYGDSLIDEYKQLTDAVHQCGARIIAQLACGGAQARQSDDGKRFWGPSAVEDMAFKTLAAEMSKDELRFVQAAFADAALRAQKMGFDGVQLHAAHGYLLSKFLSPYYNRRTDEYGGSAENRARMVVETYQAVREKVGPTFPVLIKLNCDDFFDDGMSFDDCQQLCIRLSALGIDAIEVSGGTFSSRRNEGPSRRIIAEQESYFKEYAAKIAGSIQTPVILVGGNRDLAALTQIANETGIEYFAFSRPLIREPGLIGRWQNGDLSRSLCISCNKCFGGKFGCIFNQTN